MKQLYNQILIHISADVTSYDIITCDDRWLKLKFMILKIIRFQILDRYADAFFYFIIDKKNTSLKKCDENYEISRNVYL